MPSVGWVTSRNPFLGGEYLRATRPAALCAHRLKWHTAVAQKAAVEDKREGIVLVHENGERMRPEVVVLRPLGEFTDNPVLPEMIASAKKAGQRVVADLDDDIWAHEDRPDMGGKGYEEDDHYEEWLPLVDAMIVSTRPLQRAVKDHFPTMLVAQLPNCYDAFGLSQYGPRPQPGRRIGTRLWLSGRQQADLELYDELVLPLLEELDLTFVHVGASEEWNFRTLRGWPPERLEEHPSMPAPLLGEVLGTVSIGVICLGDAPYNAAKTWTHPMELAAIGLPLVVVDETGFYRGVPGRVEADATLVRERTSNLLERDFWEKEAERSRDWSADRGYRAQEDYLWGFQQLMRRLR